MSISLIIPDIGDFAEVEVIEILVKVGDTVAKEQSLITVESDKASMEIPATHAGVLTALTVKIGDKVKMGSVLGAVAGNLDPVSTAAKAGSATRAAAQEPPISQAQSTPVPLTASTDSGSTDLECDVLVLGAGPGGYSAAFRAADW